MADKKCNWIYDDDEDCWNTSCGNEFTLNEGTPRDNRMVYCPYCGAKIKEER
jgi:predicted nucleic acid-binding Zn ribbon protein